MALATRSRAGAPHRALAAALALSLAASLAGCTSGGGSSNATGPTGGSSPFGAPASPAELGLDPDGLAALADEAEAAGSDCLLVARHGRIAGEWHWGGTDPDEPLEVYSITKSVVGLAIGQVIDDGDLALTDRVATFVPAWRGTASAEVTVEDLLSNDSGRHWDALTDYPGLIAATDRTALAVGLGQDAAPGTRWAYNNSAIQVLSAVLLAATGEEAADLVQDRIFEPLGMARSSLARDGAGHTSTFAGMRSTCSDLARLATMVLDGGRWEGEQVVPRDWVRAATGRSSQDLNAAYGYLWWVNRRGRISGSGVAVGADDGRDRNDAQLVAGAPEDLAWALGLGNQLVQVDPGSGTVLVRLAPVVAGFGAPPFGAEQAATLVTEVLRE